MTSVLAEVVKNIKNVVEDNLEVKMLNIQEYRHKIEDMSKNIQELRVSL